MHRPRHPYCHGVAAFDWVVGGEVDEGAEALASVQMEDGLVLTVIAVPASVAGVTQCTTGRVQGRAPSTVDTALHFGEEKHGGAQHDVASSRCIDIFAANNQGFLTKTKLTTYLPTEQEAACRIWRRV